MQQPMKLSISVVTYAPDMEKLSMTFDSLVAALLHTKSHLPGYAFEHHIDLIDNGPAGACSVLSTFLSRYPSLNTFLISGHGNVGYGSGHNLAIRARESDFHLVLNPDIILEADAITHALTFFSQHPECGLLAPDSYAPSRQREYLCKRYPSILVLGLRGFAPRFIKRIFQKRLDYYEMRDVIGNNVFWNPPLVSGCFMFFRTAILKKLGGFDESFFLYFEDSDLSVRARAVTQVAYVPQVRVMHFGGHSAKKGFNHIKMFIRSAAHFFGKHGWKLW